MAGGDPSPSFFAAAMGDFEIPNLYDAEEAGFDPLISPTTSNSPAELFGFPCIATQAQNMMASEPSLHLLPSVLDRDMEEMEYGSVYPMMNPEMHNHIIFESPLPSTPDHEAMNGYSQNTPPRNNGQWTADFDFTAQTGLSSMHPQQGYRGVYPQPNGPVYGPESPPSTHPHPGPCGPLPQMSGKVQVLDGPPSMHLQPGPYAAESRPNGSVHVPEDLPSPIGTELQEMNESETSSSPKRTTRTPNSARKASSAATSDKDEEKRQEALSRNRKAAQKCRRKKKDKMRGLEITVKELEETKIHLTERVHRLKEEIIFLKTLILRHSNCECVGVREYITNRARYLIGTGMPQMSTSTGSATPVTRN